MENNGSVSILGIIKERILNLHLYSKLNKALGPYRDFMFRILNIYWILKIIIHYKTQSQKLRVNALEWPVRTMIIMPMISFLLMGIAFLISSFQINFSENQIVGYFWIALFLSGMYLLLSPTIYFFRPIPIKTKEFFENNGSEHTVIEYRFVTQILYFSIPIMIIFIILVLIPQETWKTVLNDKLMFLRTVSALIAVEAALISFVGFIKFGILIVQKDFRFYLAKSSLKVSMIVEEDIEKMQYVVFAFDAYNKYLRRTLKLSLKNIPKIHQYFISQSTEDMNQTIKEIHDNMNSKNLNVLQFLAEKTKTIKFDDEFLSEMSLKDKFSEISPIIAIIASLLVSLTQLPTILDIVDKLWNHAK